MPTFLIRHSTVYRYRGPIAFGDHRMMLWPRESYDQRLIDWRIEVSPKPESVRWINDVFGNTVGIARFERKAAELRFDCTMAVEHMPQNTPDFVMDREAQTYPFSYEEGELPDLAPWLLVNEEEQNLAVE